MTKQGLNWANRLREAMQRLPPVSPQVVVVRTRGTPGAAKSAFAEVTEELFRQPSRVRLEVVDALLGQDDDLALRVLRALAVEWYDPDANIRWAIADGLARMNNAAAVDLLEAIAREDPDDSVRSCAIGSLGQRALASYATAAGPDRRATAEAMLRNRDSIRTRGGRGTSPVRLTKPAQEILDALYKLKEGEESEFVRNKVDLTLLQLGE